MLSTLESDGITVWIAHPVPTCCSSASEIWPGYHLHPGNKIPMHIPNCTAASIQPPHSLQSHWKSSDTLLGKGGQLHCFDPSFSHRCQVLQGRRCVLDHSLLPALALALLWLIGELKQQEEGGKKGCFLLGYKLNWFPGNQTCTNRRAEPASCEQQLGGGTVPAVGSWLSHSSNLPPR